MKLGPRVWQFELATTCLVIAAALVVSEARAASPETEVGVSAAVGSYKVRLVKSVMVPMRDGVRLSTDIHFPDAEGIRFPVILIRTPYNKYFWRESTSHLSDRAPDALNSYYRVLQWTARYFVSYGYIVVVQDVRGKYESEGHYLLAGGDARDGFDATNWAATQPWSTGKVGAYGCSYLGEVQYQQATLRNPHLRAMIPQHAGPVQYRAGALITGGAIELALGSGWFRQAGSKLYYRPPPGTPHEVFVATADYYNPDAVLPTVDLQKLWNTLPVIDILKKAGAPPTDWEDVVSRDFSDPWWNKTDFIRPSDRFDVPALHINSWNDFTVGDALTLFNQLRLNADSELGRDHQFAIISPMPHCSSELSTERTVVGTRDLGDPRLGYFEIYLRWFDYWLKGIDNGVTKMPKLQLYVMGKNQWRGENEWPLARTQFTKYYVHSNGDANSLFGHGTLNSTAPASETADHYDYDPRTPVPTAGGATCPTCADIQVGPMDQSAIETRNDVLVYTSSPLTAGLEVTGPIVAQLYVSSSAKDTDFVAKLVDVYPDGTAYNLQEGILRARYRDGFEKRVWMQSSEIYPLRIDLHATSNYFPRGHRIRLEISSSNFPRFDRNLNTGGNNYDETNWVVARNVLHHSAQYPSHIVLPIVR
jgi:putative CocE/NonD family hydrolase